MEEVYESLVKLDPTKAKGCDDIGPQLLKLCSTALCKPLHHLFSTSIDLSRIPLEWLVHSITPVFKSGDRSAVANYRPISCVSKVLERLVIFDFVHAQLTSVQFGFLPNRSALQQLLLFYNHVFCSLSSDRWDVIYLDFAKAFDTVPHKELLVKLHSIGINGKLWCWFQSYLSSRSQFVCINGSRSKVLRVVSGVPQGSVLGPLLFVIYVNDLPSVVRHSLMMLFADDAKCLMKVADVNHCEQLQDDLNSLMCWSE